MEAWTNTFDPDSREEATQKLAVNRGLEPSDRSGSDRAQEFMTLQDKASCTNRLQHVPVHIVSPLDPSRHPASTAR